MAEKKTLTLEDIDLDFDIEELLADIERYDHLRNLGRSTPTSLI